MIFLVVAELVVMIWFVVIHCTHETEYGTIINSSFKKNATDYCVVHSSMQSMQPLENYIDPFKLFSATRFPDIRIPIQFYLNRNHQLQSISRSIHLTSTSANVYL